MAIPVHMCAFDVTMRAKEESTGTHMYKLASRRGDINVSQRGIIILSILPAASQRRC